MKTSNKLLLGMAIFLTVLFAAIYLKIYKIEKNGSDIKFELKNNLQFMNNSKVVFDSLIIRSAKMVRVLSGDTLSVFYNSEVKPKILSSPNKIIIDGNNNNLNIMVQEKIKYIEISVDSAKFEKLRKDSLKIICKNSILLFKNLEVKNLFLNATKSKVLFKDVKTNNLDISLFKYSDVVVQSNMKLDFLNAYIDKTSDMGQFEAKKINITSEKKYYQLIYWGN